MLEYIYTTMYSSYTKLKNNSICESQDIKYTVPVIKYVYQEYTVTEAVIIAYKIMETNQCTTL